VAGEAGLTGSQDYSLREWLLAALSIIAYGQATRAQPSAGGKALEEQAVRKNDRFAEHPSSVVN
jgi:hypothetical protein